MRFPTKFNKVLNELYAPDEIKEIKSFINQTQAVKESYNKHANKMYLPTLPNITNYGMRQKGYIKNAVISVAMPASFKAFNNCPVEAPCRNSVAAIKI